MTATNHADTITARYETTRGKPCVLPNPNDCAAWSQARHDKGLPGCGVLYMGHKCMKEEKP